MIKIHFIFYLLCLSGIIASENNSKWKIIKPDRKNMTPTEIEDLDEWEEQNKIHMPNIINTWFLKETD